MKTLSIMVATAMAVFLPAASAGAVVIDFAAEAAGNERGIASGTSFASPNFGGLTLQFDADNPLRFPYFDDLSAGDPAGLGICKSLTAGPGSPCAVPSDDNITTGEGITITFLDGPLDITGLSFRNKFHDSLDANDTNQLSISINGGAANLYTFADAVAAAIAGAFMDVTSIRFAYVDRDFYILSITSEIPVPAAFPLLLSGLAGLFFASRRRGKAAA